MASPVNQNPNQFDINHLFSSPPPPSSAASFPPPAITGGYYSYQTNPNFHHQFHIPPPYFPNQQLTDDNFHNIPNPNPNLNHGARLMALLAPPSPNTPPQLSMPLIPMQNPSSKDVMTSPLRMPSNKLPKGRHLNGDRIVYDIDVRFPGELQPQLEVTPITKYGFDPNLVTGRQIAVNKVYFCYGLKPGTIRVINVANGLRSLLKGPDRLDKRVTDMAFFAEDVHLLASANMDGRFYVWKFSEGPDEHGEPQIIANVVIAVKIEAEGKPVHPRVCWHCQKQEVLLVGIGNCVLRLDTTEMGRGKRYSAEEPLICSVDSLIDGIQFVGKHDGEVTDLSMCHWMTTRLVSASIDGTIKIWADHKSSLIAVLRPHDGLPVNSVTFLTAPCRPDHIILITGGPLNREVKLWASVSEEGRLLPSDFDSWHCTQKLELKSSAELRIEDAFFNQVVSLSQSGLLLLANAKRNAIYAVHLDYGPNPETTRMDYITEFTVTMPILSCTGFSDLLPNGDHIITVNCVQTQAIQKYTLDLSLCLPPPVYDVYDYEKSGYDYEKSGSTVSHDGTGTEGFIGLEMPSSSQGSSPAGAPTLTLTPKELFWSSAESKSIPVPITNYNDIDTDISGVLSPAVPLNPKLTVKDLRRPSDTFEPHHQLNGYDDQKKLEYPVVRQLKTGCSNLSDAPSLDDDDEKKVLQEKFKHPTHLVTPAELMATSSCEVNDVAVNFETQNAEVEVKVLGEMGISQNADSVSKVDLNGTAYDKEQSGTFSSLASGLGVDMDKISDAQDVVDDMATDVGQGPMLVQSVTPSSREKKKKKNAQISSQSSSPSVSKPNDSCDDLGVSSSTLLTEPILAQNPSMQEILNQFAVVLEVAIAKEGKRIEAALGKNMEKILKANSDASWARSQEEFAKLEKSNQDRDHQVSTSATNGHKESLIATEKMVKKELAAVVRSVTQVVEKAVCIDVPTAVSEALQKGIGDKALNQLEKTVNSKLEATVSRQIQAQFQTSGKQALQEALKSSMEASVIPSFEISCKAMFDQVDSTFQKGMAEHTSAVQQQVESMHSPLAFALRDTMNSASCLTQTLSSELADGQRKLMALAVSGANTKLFNPLISQISNGPTGGFLEKIEAPVDPTKELSRLIYEQKYEEAFTFALQRSDVLMVSWLCSQVDLQGMLTSNPVPLSQGVLLSLLQQLACDIGNDTSRKLGWMMNVVLAIKPSDGIIAMHVRPIFEQVCSILNHQMSVPTTSVAEISSIRIVNKLIDSTVYLSLYLSLHTLFQIGSLNFEISS